MKRKSFKEGIALLAAILLASCQPHTNPASGSPKENVFTFAYLTDVHLNKDNRGNSNEGLRQALADAKAKGADFILFGGDNADTDALGEAETTADTLQARFKRITEECGLPTYFTIGNHDRYFLHNGEKDSLGFRLFEKHFGATYGSFDHKGVHFITLNSLYPDTCGNYSVSAEEQEWLRQDLAKTGPSTPVVISLHVPMLSLYYPVVEGKWVGADMISNAKEVFEIFRPYDVRLILQGHQHIYEQIQERNRWFVTAGAVSAFWWNGAFLETEEGYLLVHVHQDGTFSWEYIDYGWNAVTNQQKK